MSWLALSKIFVMAAVCICILDMIWLGYIAQNLYAEQIGGLLRKSSDGKMTPIWSAAVIVYLALVSGIIFFVLPKAGTDVFLACLWGALLGLIIYAVYDFTNLSILKNWPLKISIIDFLWGGLLCGISSSCTMMFKNWLLSL